MEGGEATFVEAVRGLRIVQVGGEVEVGATFVEAVRGIGIGQVEGGLPLLRL